MRRRSGKSICSLFIEWDVFLPTLELVLQPWAGVVQAVDAADSVHGLSVHDSVPLDAYQEGLAVAVDVVGHNADAVSQTECKQRVLQALVQVFPYSAGDIVLFLGRLSEVGHGERQRQRVETGSSQRVRGLPKLERIAGSHLPIVKHF